MSQRQKLSLQPDRGGRRGSGRRPRELPSTQHLWGPQCHLVPSQGHRSCRSFWLKWGQQVGPSQLGGPTLPPTMEPTRASSLLPRARHPLRCCPPPVFSGSLVTAGRPGRQTGQREAGLERRSGYIQEILPVGFFDLCLRPNFLVSVTNQQQFGGLKHAARGEPSPPGARSMAIPGQSRALGPRRCPPRQGHCATLTSLLHSGNRELSSYDVEISS